ncbi:MAG TPA: glutamate-cysteine ligase family protein [Blastocatellia bacterium]|nr:glutamate-cysteine ligase family protein [Blastocatellia bacterium]
MMNRKPRGETSIGDCPSSKTTGVHLVETPALCKADLTNFIRESGKEKSLHAVGPEFELFGFHRNTLSRLNPTDVEKVLNGFSASTRSRTEENGLTTEITTDFGRITLEPGGQIELSGWPRKTIKEIESDLNLYLSRLHEISEENGFIFLAAGFDPVRTLQEQNWIPKKRYKLMKPYLAEKGARAWDMMTRTCAIQANLDYENEIDLAKKFLLGNRLGPIIAAIFANSPFQEGKPSGYKSTRYAVWLETDCDRTGVSPAATGKFSVDQFVDYALSVPMFFVRRDGTYINLLGRQFDQFLDGELIEEVPKMQDFVDHLTTIFTDARIKPHVEVRSADSGGVEQVLALQALWKGLMYDEATLDESLRIAPNLDQNGFAALQLDVAKNGLAANNILNVLGFAKETVRLAVEGLRRVEPAEVGYLKILEQQVIDDETCPADILLRQSQKDGKVPTDSLRVA